MLPKKMPCLLCDKKLEVATLSGYGTIYVVGGFFIDLDIDYGSKFFLTEYRKEASQQEPLTPLTKLIFCDHIKAVMCDSCFEKKHKNCYGTTIKVEKTYKDYFPQDEY